MTRVRFPHLLSSSLAVGKSRAERAERLTLLLLFAQNCSSRESRRVVDVVSFRRLSLLEGRPGSGWREPERLEGWS